MSFDKINQWLMLTANLGVLIGIIAVAVELRQTQTAMSAEASSIRAQMTIELGRNWYENERHLIIEKIGQGQELSSDEVFRLERSELDALRYFENLHYQNEIGVLDSEIWEANSNSIASLCRLPSFQFVFPNWPNEPEAGRFRVSFVQLVADGCN